MSTTTYALYLRVREPFGAVQELEITSPSVLIGSGAHCDVRLGTDDARREHLRIELEGSTVIATTLDRSPPPLLCGSPFERVVVAGNDEILLAGAVLQVEARAVARPAGAARRKGFTTALCVLALAALPGLVIVALRQAPAAPIGPPPSEIAALFDARVEACAVRDVDQSFALGVKLRALGELQRERHPYEIGDGVDAVGTFRQAAECLRVAGHPAEASGAEAAAASLQGKIDEDYRVHRVRLEHALEIEDDAVALREVKALRRLTVKRAGPYVDWLGVVQRQLETRAHAQRDEGRHERGTET